MGRSADLPRSAGERDGDDAGCTILHVDMDAFYASVEIRRNPDLAGRPVIVGGGTRGVVAAASYKAREFGVRSAMPMGQALRLCPGAVVLPPDRAAYSQASQDVFAIFRDVTPLVEGLSLDEAFLDVSGALRANSTGPTLRPADIARAIRARVQEELSLTCSVGIASTKFVAKLASARCKPNGLQVVPVTDVREFLDPLPVTALWGVGQRTGEALRRLGLRTIADLAATPADTVRRAVGSAQGNHLLALAHGQDARRVTPGQGEKTVSAERTFAQDLTDPAAIATELVRMSGEVAVRLRAKGLVARTIGIKIRYADFRTVTRVQTLADATDADRQILACASALYRGLDLDRPRVRLVGVRADQLGEARDQARQLEFDMSGSPASAKPVNAALGRVLDRARERFGDAAPRPGSLLEAHAAAKREDAVP
jgi:DNA polymerase-4